MMIRLANARATRISTKTGSFVSVTDAVGSHCCCRHRARSRRTDRIAHLRNRENPAVDVAVTDTESCAVHERKVPNGRYSSARCWRMGQQRRSRPPNAGLQYYRQSSR